MLFTTTSQWIALALTLLGGWLLGLASHPGGRKWRERYAAEREAHAAARRDAEARHATYETRIADYERGHAQAEADRQRIAELERDRAELDAARARIAELERERVRVAHPEPRTVSEPVRAQTTQAGVAPVSRRVIRPAGERRGWFDWGPGNDPRAKV